MWRLGKVQRVRERAGRRTEYTAAFPTLSCLPCLRTMVASVASYNGVLISPRRTATGELECSAITNGMRA
jgi:hypothetical protein